MKKERKSADKKNPTISWLWFIIKVSLGVGGVSVGDVVDTIHVLRPLFRYILLFYYFLMKITIYLIGFILINLWLGLFGLAIGIIGAVLAYTNTAYREWLKKQRGYKFRLSKFPGMASSSPTVLAIATICNFALLSLLGWYILLMSITNPKATIGTLAIMVGIGFVLFYGWLIQGWGLKPTQQVEPDNVIVTSESRSSANNKNDFIDYFKQNRLASILIPFAIITPFICGMSGMVLGPIIITPTPTSTVIPFVTPGPIGTKTPLSTTKFTSSQEILTIDNNKDMAALFEVGDSDPFISEFAKKYSGRIIQFDGYLAKMTPHENYKTRFDLLIYSGNYGKPSGNALSFKFEDINIVWDLKLTGSKIPENISEGQNLRITAKVMEYKEVSGLFFLTPVSTEIR